MPKDRPSVIHSIWEAGRDQLIARGIDICNFFYLIGSLVIIHFAMLAFLHFGWLPEVSHAMDVADQYVAAISVIWLLITSLVPFLFHAYKAMIRELR